MTIGDLLYQIIHLPPMSFNAADYKPLGQMRVVQETEEPINSIELGKTASGEPVLIIK